MRDQTSSSAVATLERSADLLGGDSSTASLLKRIEASEALGEQIGQAIEQLVDAVVGLQQQPAPTPPSVNMPDMVAALSALERRLQGLEQQVTLNHACQDLVRTSLFHPKERCIVFVGTTYFGCNVKYAWLAFREKARQENIACWFLPQTEEQEHMIAAQGEQCFPAQVSRWTTEHVTAALSTAVVVLCDHFLNPNPYAAALMSGAHHVQLWHGISIKEIGLRNLTPPRNFSPHFARIISTCGPFNRFIGTASTQEDQWRKWFGIQHYEPIGYPRNDVLLRTPTPQDLLNVDREVLADARRYRQQGKYVFLYAPTFRDANRGQWILEAGLDKLARKIETRGHLLIVNLHPVEAPMKDQLAKLLPSVRFTAPRTDIYPILREISILITDYSSIMFDFLLLDRPIWLFRPDDTEYRRTSRKIIEDDADQPGPLLRRAADLITMIDNTAVDTHAQARRKLCERLFDHTDAMAGQRLSDLLLKEVADKVCASGPGNDKKI